MPSRHRFIVVSLLTLLLLPCTASAYSVSGGRILDAQGQPVQLRGVNWFGFETTDHVAHGLWARNWKSMVDQMRQLGFNAVRLPVCPGTLRGVAPSSINDGLNPDLAGLDSLRVLDAVVHYLDAQGLYVLFDHHRPDCQAISELWYTPQYSEAQWLADLTFLAARYGGVPRVMGIDPKNEPHGAATWGTGNSATDWNRAAERAAAAVAPVAPHWLIFVEGIADNPSCSANGGPFWGENLEPLVCTPLAIPADRLVLSPHTYGPDVFPQPYFNDPTFPANMPALWERRFGRFIGAHAVVLGEFGGKYGQGDPRDVRWQDALVDYLVGKGVDSGFYWSWNPNSGDTGGILTDDWIGVRQDKVALLRRLWGGSTLPSTPVVTLTVSPTSIAAGQTATLAWSATHATTCTASGAWSGARPTSGSLGVSPASTATYALTCTGPGGTASGSATLTVAAAPSVTLLPAQLQVSSDWGTGYCVNASVTNAGATRVVWAADVAVQGTIREAWSATASAASGTVRFTGVSWNRELAPGRSTQFGFCANRTPAGGAQPPSVTISVAPATVAVGQTATLTWSSTHATSCTASGAWGGPQPTAGSQSITATAPGTSSYGLTCTGAGGTASGAATLTVHAVPSGPGLLPAQARVTTDWGTGYCAEVTVTNTTAARTVWSTQLAVQGSITQIWNATASGLIGTVRFAGVDWNRELAPGASAAFGFCAFR
jgi:endoglucanase